jgi:4-hydroxy-4-methyl-2-oxoglutarate aldolase
MAAISHRPMRENRLPVGRTACVATLETFTDFMNATLTASEMEYLRRMDASILANAIETFKVRLRNEGFISDPALRCLFPELPPILGYAATLKIRGSAPPTAAGLYADRTDWWDYVVSLPAPRVVVVQDEASREGVGSLLGAVHVNILRALGCVAAVTNGAVRDLPAAQQIGFQLFAKSVSVSHAYVHIVEFGTPVNVCGLKILSGELLHGDVHGVQSIPQVIASKIPEVAATIAAREKSLIALCQSRDFSINKLRAAVSAECL